MNGGDLNVICAGACVTKAAKATPYAPRTNLLILIFMVIFMG